MFDITLGTAVAELLVALVAWTGIWYAIRWRERVRVAKGLASHSGLRLVFAAAAMLTILFSGGCTLFFVAGVLRDYMAMGSSDVEGGKLLRAIIGMILMIGGIPFAAAIVLWFVLMARKKS